MGGNRRDSKGRVQLTSDPAGKLRRRLWILLPLAIFLIARFFPHDLLAATENYKIQVGDRGMDVSVDGRFDDLTSTEFHDFLRNSAQGVAAYFGRFPVPEARVLVRVDGGRSIADGRTVPGPGLPTIYLQAGSEITPRGLHDDWVVVHEMTHLGLPNIGGGPHRWMSEGLATYAEPIERVRNGTLTIERFWSDMVRDLPRGLPLAGEDGFDNTHTWASTYWGGCLFWFLADVRIREATHNQKGLEDALRAMNREDGDFRSSWSLEKFLSVTDGEIGSPVMRKMYDEWARRKGSIDLDQLWKRLGVMPAGWHQVAFDDSAPLARVRRAITGNPPK